MKTIIALALSIASAACTTIGDDTVAPDAGTPDVDAPPATTDEFPTGDYAHQVCYTSREGDQEWTTCEVSETTLPNLPAGQKIYFIGYCGQAQDYTAASDPILGIERGSGYVAFKNDQVGLNDGDACEFTYAWKDANGVWHYAQYPDSTMSKSRAGELRECGNRTYTRADGSTYIDWRCGMFLKRVAGHRAQPYGSYPATPVQN